MAEIGNQKPNDPTYWQAVKHNAAYRKAMAKVRHGFAVTDCGLIDDAWVADLMDLVRSAAYDAGFLNDPVRYQSFREDCAAFMQLPEIATEDHKALSQAAFDAIDATARALYGNKGA